MSSFFALLSAEIPLNWYSISSGKSGVAKESKTSATYGDYTAFDEGFRYFPLSKDVLWLFYVDLSSIFNILFYWGAFVSSASSSSVGSWSAIPISSSSFSENEELLSSGFSAKFLSFVENLTEPDTSPIEDKSSSLPISSSF